MTSVKEYIDFLFNKLNELAFEYISYSDYARMTDWLDEINKQVERLERKQDPMKPDRLDGFRCRNCSGKLARQTDLVRQKHCHHCGQKLDWED